MITFSLGGEVFLIAARLNVLNFLVGMLCHSAESVVEAENEAKFRKEVAAVPAELGGERLPFRMFGVVIRLGRLTRQVS